MSNTKDNKTALLEKFREEKEWFFVVRNFNNVGGEWPFKDLYYRGGSLGEVFLYEVLEYLEVDLSELSQLFVQNPHKYYTLPEDQRDLQEEVSSYRDLGMLRAWDIEGWRKLAKMVGKTIDITHRTPGVWPEDFNFRHAFIVYPDDVICQVDGVEKLEFFTLP